MTEIVSVRFFDSKFNEIKYVSGVTIEGNAFNEVPPNAKYFKVEDS